MGGREKRNNCGQQYAYTTAVKRERDLICDLFLSVTFVK
jgi:hypothetical protein